MTNVQKTPWPDDEALVAYVDGELDAVKSAAVEAFLATSPEARDFVDRLRLSASLAAEALTPPVERRDFDPIAEMIATYDLGKSAGDVVAFKPRRSRYASSPYALPIAAAMALLVGGLAGYRLGGEEPTNVDGHLVAIGQVTASSPMLKLLDARASGESMTIASHGDTVDLIVTATYRDRANRICREFESTKAGETPSDLTIGFACRAADGRWRVEAATHVVAATDGAGGGDFTPASGEKASAIEGLLKAIGADRALPASEERELLEKGWK